MPSTTIYLDHNPADSNDSPGIAGTHWTTQFAPVHICRTVYGGSLTIREDRSFLPQFEKEEDDAYSTRLGQAILFNAFRKTIRGLTGMAFRKDPDKKDVHKEIQTHLENIDLTGRHFDVFAQDSFRDKLTTGHVGIFVDWAGPENPRSRRSEQGARPYWTMVRKEQILRFRTITHHGETILASVAFYETESVKDGAFGNKIIERVRQYDLGIPNLLSPVEFSEDEGDYLELFEDQDLDLVKAQVYFRSWTRDYTQAGVKEGSWIDEETGRWLGPRMDRIPFTVDYGARTGFMTSEPPLLDLALENIRHYQVRSDRDTNLHVASVPIFVVYGAKAKELSTVTVGSAIGLAFQKGPQEVKVEYVETQGTALKESRQELLDIEKRMASLGLSFIERQTRAAETAEKHKEDTKAQESELASLCRASSDAFAEALVYHAKWMGIGEDGGNVTINTDFDDAIMDAAIATLLLKMVGEGRLSIETMWDRLVEGRILPDTFDPDEEHGRLGEAAATLEAVTAILERQRIEQQNQLPVDEATPEEQAEAERRAREEE